MEAGYAPQSQAHRTTPGLARRLTTETKQAFKTTEFWAYLVAVLAVLIAGTVDDAEGSQFGAEDVWLYITLLTIGYMIARGIAKAGSRDPYWDSPDHQGDDGSFADRVKTAAHVLREGDTAAHSPDHSGDVRRTDPGL